MPVRVQHPFPRKAKIISASQKRKHNSTGYAQSRSTLGLSLALALLIAGCGESKVAQCNQLIEMVNDTERTLGNITQSSPPDISALQDIADATSRAETELKTVNLRNKRLNQFKNRFLEFYSSISQDAQTIVTAHQTQNMPDAEAAYKRLEETFKNQEPLVNDINDFCSENYTGS